MLGFFIIIAVLVGGGLAFAIGAAEYFKRQDAR